MTRESYFSRVHFYPTTSVRAKATGITSLSNQANIDARATEKLKREVAKLGAHIVLLQAQNTQRGIYGITNPDSQGYW
ncbi:hypothetical protein [Hymenobacter psoromatis]|uniref:hypothetical protein n=1 Tax=Hymenobacter psoromatis TaxID=1484116 RepID=UPI001CC11E56|nr:hypothetical protein [Hymenobacter psoromatis]